MYSLLFTFYRFGRALRHGIKDTIFQTLLIIVTLLLTSGTLFYHAVEKWSYLDSLYFSVATLTTVGYGDITPHTVMAKVFTIFYIFVGVGMILAFVNRIAYHTFHDHPARLLMEHAANQKKKAGAKRKKKTVRHAHK